MLTLLVQEIHEELKQKQNELEAERKQNYECIVWTEAFRYIGRRNVPDKFKRSD